jgi:beta-glucanase (GH16 family)
VIGRRGFALGGGASLAAAASPREALVPTFEDDFETFDWNANSATTADPSRAPSGRWSTRYWWGDGLRTMPNNRERQFYSDAAVGPDPFGIVDGALVITARPSPDPAATRGLPYTSGIVTTEGTFSQRYGWFEMRARLPRGRGLWPAFWLLPQDHSWPPEIDIVEVLGHEPTRFFGSAHTMAAGERRAAIRDAEVGDLSDGFHTFALSWRPDRLRWHVDGRPVVDLPTEPDMHRPMYMLANLAVGGAWPGDPDASTPFPATMAIDHIRAYQFSDL